MESSSKVISQLFEQREREFLLLPVRVMAKSSVEPVEVGSVVLNSLREGEIAEVPRWVAEELADLSLAEIQEEPFEGEIANALLREKMQGSLQLSSLSPNFYLRMRRRLSAIKRSSETGGKHSREEYLKLRASCYDLIGRRLSKLLAMSSSASIQTFGDKVTPEERVFFTSSRSFSEQWKNALLGE